ncbi:MAG: hypothetical protein NVSMB19_19650 [Vulcanimicrobiaceae bacterium]
MDGRRRAHRLSIVRYGRRYSACGLGAYRARGTHAAARRRAGLLPGMTLALIALFAVFVLERPPNPPDDPQRRIPIAGVAHYTFADFASAAR